MAKQETILDHWETKGSYEKHVLRLREIGIPPEVSIVSMGTLLRDIRSTGNLTQADIANALGWKGASSRVSDIESGIAESKRGFVDLLCRNLGLDEYTRSKLLLSGSFLASEEDINEMAKFWQPLLDRNQFPAHLTDFGGRILLYNPAFLSFSNLEGKQDRLRQDRPSFIEMIFNPSWGLRERFLSCWKEISSLETDSFYIDETRHGAAYRWYELLFLRLIRLEGFKEAWDETLNIGWHGLLRKHPLLGAERKIIIKTDSEVNSFRAIHSPPLPTDARLNIITYIPET